MSSRILRCISGVSLFSVLMLGCSVDGKDAGVQKKLMERFASDYPRVGFLVERDGGACEFSNGVMASHPVDWHQPAYEVLGKGMGAVEALSGNRFLSVNEVRDGVVLIKWKDVSSNIMSVKFDKLEIPDSVRYSAHRSLEFLLSQPAVLDVIKSKKMRIGLRFASLAGEPAKDGPSLKTSYENIDFEGALLIMLDVFRGSVFYDECKKSDGVTSFNVFYYSSGERNI